MGLRWIVVAAALLTMVLPRTALSQSANFELSIAVSDGANTKSLTVGMDPEATDGTDDGTDQPVPPAAPGESFDARIKGQETDYVTDIRASTTEEVVFELAYRPQKGEGPITLSWNNEGLAEIGTFFIVDPEGKDIDMTTASSFDVSTAQGDLSSGLLVRVQALSNRPPEPSEDIATVAEDSFVVVAVLENDSDPEGDALAVSAVGKPANGTAVLSESQTIQYRPVADFYGNDSFTYTVDDGSGRTAQSSVTVTVTPVNDPPTFTSTPVTSVREGVNYNYEVAVEDKDGDQLALAAAEKPPWLSFTDQNDGTALLSGTPPAKADGNHLIRLEASDDSARAEQTFTLTVKDELDPNQPPVARSDTAVTTENQPVTVSVLDNDTDADQHTLRIAGTESPANGKTTVNNDSTAVVYTPQAGFLGQDSFTYTVTDSYGGTATAAVKVTVEKGVVASKDTAATEENSPVQIDVLANDVWPSGESVALTVIAGPAYGNVVVEQNNQLTYTPDEGFSGEEVFTYEIKGQSKGSDQATVSVTVYPGNNAPTAAKISLPDDGAEIMLGGDSSRLLTIKWNESTDPDGDNVNYTWEAALVDNFSRMIYRKDTGNRQEVAVPYDTLEQALGDEGINVANEPATLYHRVIVSDGDHTVAGKAARFTVGRVSTATKEPVVPQTFKLESNYPNPFNPTTTIPFTIPVVTHVHLALYNAHGQHVATLVDEVRSAGSYTVRWDGSGYSSGVYVCRMKAGSYSQTRALLLLK